MKVFFLQNCVFVHYEVRIVLCATSAQAQQFVKSAAYAHESLMPGIQHKLYIVFTTTTV